MAELQVKKPIKGVHNVAIADYKTGAVEAILKVVDSVNIDLGESVVSLKGGESNDAYAADIVDANNTVTVPVKEFPSNLMAMLYHNTATDAVAEATGAISTPFNVKGTTAYNPVTGVASIAVTSGATPVEGVYLFVAAKDNKFNIYGFSDFDCALAYQNDQTGLVSPLTAVVLDASEDIAALGITLTGGSAIALVEGDSFIFEIRRPNSGYSEVSLGGECNKGYKRVYLFFGETQEKDLTFIELYKCTVSRGALSTPVRDYASQEITITPVKDPTKSNKIGKWHRTNN